MKSPLLPVLVLVLASPLWAGAPDSPAPLATAAAKSKVAGDYAGKWNGSGDASGTLKIKLTQDEKGAWSVESSFTYEGQVIPTRAKSAQVEGTKVEMVFEWEINGTPGRSKLQGELSGETLKGTFETSGEAGTSAGTWTVTRS